MELRSDYRDPLRLSDEEFDFLVTTVDAAFVAEEATFRHAQYGSRSIVILDGAPDQVVEWAGWLDQLLWFAFEEVPEDVIRNWASTTEEDLGEIAVGRADKIRKLMPNARANWDFHSQAILPALADVRSEVLRSEGSEWFADLQFAEGIESPYQYGFDETPRRIHVRLLRPDLKHLMKQLERILQSTGEPVD